MKNELKALYKKDKKLALDAAKVLGYKIVVKAVTYVMDEKGYASIQQIRRDLTDISSKVSRIKTEDKYLKKAVNDIENKIDAIRQEIFDLQLKK